MVDLPAVFRDPTGEVRPLEARSGQRRHRQGEKSSARADLCKTSNGNNRYFSCMEQFSTRRLTAERLHDGHLADLVALHLDPLVSQYLGGVRSPEATQTYLAANISHWERHGFGLWMLRTRTGEFAGRAGLRHLTLDGANEVEIAYTFKHSMWGQGFASEIAAALIQLGLVQLQLPSLIGVVAVENAASRRVLEKSDFHLERSATYHGDDVVIYRSPVAAPATAHGVLFGGAAT
jgi:RimJ/RimL family protein N-acetyltransferase